MILLNNLCTRTINGNGKRVPQKPTQLLAPIIYGGSVYHIQSIRKKKRETITNLIENLNTIIVNMFTLVFSFYFRFQPQKNSPNFFYINAIKKKNKNEKISF